jgi:hypothetical protein
LSDDIAFSGGRIFRKQPEALDRSSEHATFRRPKSFLIPGRADMVESLFFITTQQVLTVMPIAYQLLAFRK